MGKTSRLTPLPISSVLSRGTTPKLPASCWAGKRMSVGIYWARLVSEALCSGPKGGKGRQ